MDIEDICVLLSFLMVKADGNFFVSENPSSWTVGGSNCTFAVPQLSYSSDGEYAVVDIDKLEVNETVLADIGFWVGYCEIPRPFDYIGCLPLHTVLRESVNSKNVTKASPGICYSACAHESFFGIFKNKCFCLKTNVDSENLRTTQQNCNVECDDQAGLACGGSLGNDSVVISIYRYNPDAKSRFELDGASKFCLKVKPKYKHYQWSNCSEQLPNICDFDGTYLATSSKVDNKSWIDNSNVCIQHGGKAVSFENNVDTKLKNYDQLWTNVIRSPTILSARSIMDIDLNSFRNKVEVGYGFIQKHNDTIHLKFSQSPDIMRYILCTKDTDSVSADWGVTVGTIVAVTIVLLVIIITVAKNKRRFRNPFIMNKKYSLRNERDQEIAETNAIVNIEEIHDVERNSLVQAVDIHVVAEQPDHFDESNYDTSRKMNESLVKTNNIYNGLTQDNMSTYESTLTKDQNLKGLSASLYDSTKRKHSNHSGIIELQNAEEASVAKASELRLSSEPAETVKCNDVYDDVEFKIEKINDEIIQDGEHGAFKSELSALKNLKSKRNNSKCDVSEIESPTDRNMPEELTNSEIFMAGNLQNNAGHVEPEIYNSNEESLEGEYISFKFEVPVSKDGREGLKNGGYTGFEIPIDGNDVYDDVEFRTRDVEGTAEKLHSLDRYVTLKENKSALNDSYITVRSCIDVKFAMPTDKDLQRYETYDDLENVIVNASEEVEMGVAGENFEIARDDKSENLSDIGKLPVNYPEGVEMSMDGEKFDIAAQNDRFENLKDDIIEQFELGNKSKNVIYDNEVVNLTAIDYKFENVKKIYVPKEFEISSFHDISENVKGFVNEESALENEFNNVNIGVLEQLEMSSDGKQLRNDTINDVELEVCDLNDIERSPLNDDDYVEFKFGEPVINENSENAQSKDIYDDVEIKMPMS